MTHEEVKQIIKQNKGIENKINDMFKSYGLAYEIRPHEYLDDYGVMYFIYIVDSKGDRMRCNCGYTPKEALRNLKTMFEIEGNTNDPIQKSIRNKLNSIYNNV